LTVVAARHSACAPAAGRDPLVRRIGAWSRRETARALVNRNLDLHVSGLEHVPEVGPVILVARHYHHLYDAAAILATVPREVHVLIAVDWLDHSWRMAVMRRLAAAAHWPAVWRRGPAWRLNRRAYCASLDILEQGRVLLVFPEGYPIIDPRPSPRTETHAFLPFDAGFLVLAERARRQVPVVPVGLAYAKRATGGWSVWLRFGAPVRHARLGRAERPVALARLESAVRDLSTSPG
jgi:1-acyl-sn-glycerol-3-phosphate acyltransferase